MDAILFGMKRAHMVLQQRLAAPMLAPCALTPARFDTLYAIAQEQRGDTQERIRQMLGISAPTLSRMLGVLERLLFITRGPFRRGRRRSAKLTSLGRAVLRHATKRTMRRRVVRDRVDAVVHKWATGRYEAREHLDYVCKQIRAALNDRATLLYWWPRPIPCRGRG
jgi:DNA-binding MarR family transcriptional regulator